MLVVNAVSFSAVASTQYTIDFDDPNFIAPGGSDGNWGQVIDDEYFGTNDFGGLDVTFWTSVQTGVTGFNGLDFNASLPITNLGNGQTRAPYLVLFNTQYAPSDDPDLEVGIDNGDGRASNYTGGNIAIINENWDDGDNYERCQTVSGELACKDPDDRYAGGNGAPYGGWVFIEFSKPVNLHSIDLIDMESGSNQLGQIGYYGAAQNLIGSQSMLPTTTNTTKSSGDGGWLTQTLNNALTVTTLVLRMQGSGGFDNLVFSTNGITTSTVSEPSTIAVLAFGLFGLMLRAKRK